MRDEILKKTDEVHNIECILDRMNFLLKEYERIEAEWNHPDKWWNR